MEELLFASAADVRETIPTTNVPKAGDTDRQEAWYLPRPSQWRGAGLSEEQGVRTTHNKDSRDSCNTSSYQTKNHSSSSMIG